MSRWLNTIYRAANEACAEAKRQHDADPTLFEGDAINWADLRCIDAERVISQDGTEHERVYIQEADPTAEHLRNFISERLYKGGFGDIEVVTEW